MLDPSLVKRLARDSRAREFILRGVKTTTLGRLIMLGSFVLVLAGCPNGFSEFANKNSDEALLYQAQLYADQRDWDNAILSVTRMSASGRTNRDTKYFLASAYAGRCGLDLLNLANALTGLSSSKLFPLLLTQYSGLTTTSLADCESAESTLLGISTNYTELTADENILLAFLEFVKIGAVLGSNANIDADGNGSYDGDYWTDNNAVDICSEARTDVTDSEIDKVVTGIMIAFNALTQSGSDITNDLGSIGTICTTLGGCNVQSASDVTPTQRLVVRGLFKSNEIGFDTCGGSYGTNPAGRTSDCFCPTVP